MGRKNQESRFKAPYIFESLSIFPLTPLLSEEHTKNYVEAFINKVALPFVSWDIYPITTAGIKTEWYKNLEIMRTVCMRHNLPFWTFALATPPYHEHNLSHSDNRATAFATLHRACLWFARLAILHVLVSAEIRPRIRLPRSSYKRRRRAYTCLRTYQNRKSRNTKQGFCVS